MVQPLQFPAFPPEGPWSAYVWFIIWFPLLMRVFFLVIPFRAAIKKLAPHSGWAIKQLRSLPVKGFTILAINETLAFVVPALIIFTLRLLADPVGWQTWDQVPSLGFLLLILTAIIWLILDFFRIIRVRRMLKAVSRYDIDRLKKAADVGLGARSWLRRFSKKGKKKSTEERPMERVGKRSLKVWGSRALLARKLNPGALLTSVAVGAAIEAARAGAGKLSDIVDDKMQEEFDKIAKTNTKTLFVLLLRDIAMGVLPIIVLAILPNIL